MSTVGDADLVRHLSIPSSFNLRAPPFESILDQVDKPYMSPLIIPPPRGNRNDDDSKTGSFPGSPTDLLFGWTAHNSLYGETAGDALPNGRVISASTGWAPGESWSRYRNPFLQHDGQDPKIAKTDREERIQEWDAAIPSFSMVDINVSATPFDPNQGSSFTLPGRPTTRALVRPMQMDMGDIFGGANDWNGGSDMWDPPPGMTSLPPPRTALGNEKSGNHPVVDRGLSGHHPVDIEIMEEDDVDDSENGENDPSGEDDSSIESDPEDPNARGIIIDEAGNYKEVQEKADDDLDFDVEDSPLSSAHNRARKHMSQAPGWNGDLGMEIGWNVGAGDHGDGGGVDLFDGVFFSGTGGF